VGLLSLEHLKNIEIPFYPNPYFSGSHETSMTPLFKIPLYTEAEM
jgi:hypothetical protein